MVHRASPTMPPNERNACLPRRAQVYLLPWVLVPTYDHARAVPVQQQQRLLWVLVPKEPITQISFSVHPEHKL